MSKRVVLTLFVIGMLLLLLVQNAGKTTWSMRGNRSWKGDSSAYMYDNVTTHYGNLIVDGTQTFVIENCRYIQIGDILVKGYAELQLKDCEFVLNQSTYYQWNISVNENAQLHSENVSITSNFSYDQFYDDESIVTFNETNLDTFCWIYGNGASLTFHNSSDSGDILVSTQVLFVNSSAEFVSTYPDAAVMIENSTMDFVSVGTKNSSVIARNLGGTYVSRFNTFENLTITGGRTSNVTVITSTLCISFEAYWEASSLAIYDSYIKGVAVAFGSEVFIDMCDGSGQGFDLSIQNSTAVIYNSNISYIVSTLNSVFSVYNSTISYGIHFYGGSDRGYCFECRISEIDVQSFGGTIMMDRTEVFGGPVGVYRYVEDSQFYVSGNISFTGNSHVMEWKNSTVTRSFVTSCRNKTSPLENAMLTLYDSSRSVVWSGLSDPDGRAEFNLTFTDSNYTDTLRLEAVKGEWYGTSNVSFLSDTPVTLTLGTHDMAITDVAPSRTVVGHDYLALIMVSVENQDDFTETFNVTAYYNQTAIMIEQWPDGANSQIFWSMGDVNRDGYIDNWDVYKITQAFGSSPRNPRWNPDFDINSDGVVNMKDIGTCAKNFGKDIWTFLGLPKLIENQRTVTLASGNSSIITFRWNTTDVVEGNYTISAYAWPVPGETDTADNTFIEGTIYVGIPGDINGDGTVDIYDAIMLAGAYNSKLNDPTWNANADINSDANVDIYDAIILAGNFNKHVP